MFYMRAKLARSSCADSYRLYTRVHYF